MPNLDPSSWDPTEIDATLAAWNPTGGPDSATGAQGVVVVSSGRLAAAAGRHALEAGGSAVDAAITASLAQIALAVGSWVSYAGIFSGVFFDAATGTTHSLSAGFGTFAGETDPASIPMFGSGRTALVPGYMAGAAAAHVRFGRLPWAELFAPARHVAERGLPAGPVFHAFAASKLGVLAATPEGREIFGGLGDVTDVFRQPALAHTLGQVAEQGADYMYRGQWAERFVNVVQREGGKATLSDLENYAPIWDTPLEGSYRGATVMALAGPDNGGAALIEGLHLMEQAGLDSLDPAEALYWLIHISRQGHVNRTVPARLRATTNHAVELWAAMAKAGGCVGPMSPAGTHSDFAVAADSAGNVAALCHSINSAIWGSSGLFVDGVSIPDAAGYQQRMLAELEPGSNMGVATNPSIALRDGKPVLGSASIGTGMHEVTLQCVARTLNGMSIGEAVQRPLVQAPEYTTYPESYLPDGWPDGRVCEEQMLDPGFDPELIAACRQPVRVRGFDDANANRGWWGGVAGLTGARTPGGGRVEVL